MIIRLLKLIYRKINKHYFIDNNYLQRWKNFPFRILKNLIWELIEFSFYIYNYFFSYHCINCKIEILYHNGLCNKCWIKLDILDSDICGRCGKKNKLYCCQNNDLYKQKKIEIIFRHGLKMNQFTKQLIHNFKYYDNFTTGEILTNLILKYIPDNKYDYLIPIPMFYLKKIIRIYNPTLEIAKTINKNKQIELLTDLLYKNKFTPSQTSLSQIQRKRNIKNSFKIYNGNRIKNKNIILINDIYTTDATFKENTRQLLIYKPKKILCISLAYN